MEEENDVDLVVPQMPRGDEGGAQEEREHVEMPQENGVTPTGLEGA